MNSESCEIIDWDYEPVYGGAGHRGEGLSNIYRFTGKGRDKDVTVFWSLMLKAISSPDQGGDPQGGRERLAYQSGASQLNLLDRQRCTTNLLRQSSTRVA
ncbi:MAG: hypothetical protein AAF702_25945 [Chloroflexota bacterium]